MFFKPPPTPRKHGACIVSLWEKKLKPVRILYNYRYVVRFRISFHAQPQLLFYHAGGATVRLIYLCETWQRPDHHPPVRSLYVFYDCELMRRPLASSLRFRPAQSAVFAPVSADDVFHSDAELRHRELNQKDTTAPGELIGECVHHASLGASVGNRLDFHNQSL